MTVCRPHEHTPEAVAKRLAQTTALSYLRDWIYGGIDGAVTTFAIISGVIGGGLSHVVIIILGIANVMADGFSMAASNYLGTKAEREEFQRYQKFEREQVQHCPEGETEEIRQIYRKKGLSGEALEKVVESITSDPEVWVDTMLSEEYGLPKNIRSPVKSAMSTFCAFIVCGMVPLLPYLLPIPRPEFYSILSTALVFVLIGSLKSKWTVQRWWVSGLVTLGVGAGAAILSYLIGYFVQFYLKR